MTEKMTEKVLEEIPLTVMISTEKKTRGVVTIIDTVAAIRALKISREQVGSLPMSWRSGSGFYVLVSDIADGKYHAYVGKATQNNFYNRLISHRSNKPNWTHAFLFQRDTSTGINSTQTAYVEGAIYDILSECSWISVINSVSAGDKTLADHEIFYMNQVVKSALRIMNIFGYVIEDEQRNQAEKEASTGNKYYGVNIAQLVKSGLLKEGEEVISLEKKLPAVGSVGSKGIIIGGGEHVPSRAAIIAAQLTNPTIASRNGWSFWGINRGGTNFPLAHFRDHYLSQKRLYEDSLLTENIEFEESVRKNENARDQYLSSIEGPEEESPEYCERHKDSRVLIYQILDAGLLEEGTKLICTKENYPVEDAYIANGGIALAGNIYPSPHIASKYAKRLFDPTAGPENGWEFWAVLGHDGRVIKFSSILDDYLASEQ